MHADFAHGPSFIPDLVRRIESGADIVIAQSKLEGEPSRARRLVRRLAPVLLRGMVSVPGVTGRGFRILRSSGWSPCVMPSAISRAAADDPGLGRQRRALRPRRSPCPAGGDHLAPSSGGTCGSGPAELTSWDAALIVWRSRGPLRHLPARRPFRRSRTPPASSRQARWRRRDQPDLALVRCRRPSAPGASLASYPFAVGEKLSYSAKLGMLTLGSGTLEVASIDTVRGVESFRLRFRLQGKTMFYSLDDVLESWVGITDLSSRRFVQDFVENDKSYEAPATRSTPIPGSSASTGRDTRRPRRPSRSMMRRSSILSG